MPGLADKCNKFNFEDEHWLYAKKKKRIKVFPKNQYDWLNSRCVLVLSTHEQIHVTTTNIKDIFPDWSENFLILCLPMF